MCNDCLSILQADRFGEAGRGQGLGVFEGKERRCVDENPEKDGVSYGDDISGGKAFSVDSKSCPDYIGGVYLDDSGRLVIQIKGDSLVVRKRLEKELGTVDFIIEPGLCYTQKELLRINDELVGRWRELEGTPVMKNVQSAGVCIHDIQIDLMVNTPEKQQEFREKVMDSPAFRFTGSREAVLNDEEGVNDVAGVSIRPEYTVYSTEADKVKFIIYNHSGELLHCGTRYVITYEDVDGTWRELPINNIFLDTEYGVSNEEGRSVIAFIIERDGSVNDVRVLRSSGDEQLDTEALRIIKSSPKWLPGEYRKQPVRVQYIVPVNFRK